MATSSSWNFSLTAANIIEMALENLDIVADGQAVSTTQNTFCLRRLNVLAKQFQGTADLAQGVKVHTRQRITLMLAKGQQEYLIGPASTDARASTQVGRTTIDVAETVGQTVLSVTATTDTTTYPGTTLTMTASDFIGIEQDDGTIFWSTVSSISAGDTVTIATGLDVAAAVGRYVWWFASRAQRFPVLESAVLRESGYTTTPLGVYVQAEQYDQGVADKYADGTPATILVEPLRTATRVTLDSKPTDVTQQIILTVLYPSEDYDATTDDIAFPQEWLRPLSWALSLEIAPAFGRPWTPDMELNRKESLIIARNLNPQNSVLYFRPNA